MNTSTPGATPGKNRLSAPKSGWLAPLWGGLLWLVLATVAHAAAPVPTAPAPAAPAPATAAPAIPAPALAVPATSAAPAAPVEAVAMVMDLEGQATISDQSGKSQAGEILMTLAPGVSLTVAEKGRIRITYYGNATEYAYTGPATVRIGPTEPETVAGGKPEQKVVALAKDFRLEPTDSRVGAMTLRGGPQAKKPVLIGPKNTALLPDAPILFHWESFGANVTYHFLLRDATGKVLKEQEIKETTLRLEGVPLEPGGNYSWLIEARLPTGEIIPSRTSDFRILAREVAARLKQHRPAEGAPFSERLAYALVLEQTGLREMAQEAWARLAAERPASPEIRARSGK